MFCILLVDVLLPFAVVLILFVVVLSFFEVASLRCHFASLYFLLFTPFYSGRRHTSSDQTDCREAYTTLGPRLALPME